MLLMELARNISDDAAADFDDVTQSFIQLSNFVSSSNITTRYKEPDNFENLDFFLRQVASYACAC